MSLASPNLIPRAIVNTVLAPLIPLLLPGAFGNLEEAHAAAVELLLEYCPGTREELRLAGEVVGFGLQVLDALREAALPGTSYAVVLRLRVIESSGEAAGTCKIGGYLSGELVIEAEDPACGELKGEGTALAAGATNNGVGVVANFAAIVVRVPVRF